MHAVTLNPVHKQLFQVHAEQSHSRVSARKVLYAKLLRWIDKTPIHTICKTMLRILSVLGIILAFAVPNFFFGLMLSGLNAHGPLIGRVACAVMLALYGRSLIRWARRLPKRAKGNQHTYHGLPIDELASFLAETNAWKMDTAMQTFGIAQTKWKAIAEELEENGVLTRGENNARVLRPISRADLVRQLRDKFPLAWSDERDCWYERNGTFERWAIAQDFKQRKLTEKTERAERKLDRVQEKLAQASTHPLFAGLHA